MFRKLLLPALAIATLAGCATGYSYRDGSGDYYYGRPSVEYRHYGGIGYGGYGGYGYGGFGIFGGSYSLDVFGRPLYGYPYGYYGRPTFGYPYWHAPRPPHRPGQGHGGHDGGGHHGPPPAHGDYRPGRKPPWRDLGRIHQRGEGEGINPRRAGQPDARPMTQRAPPPVRSSAPVNRERRESRPASAMPRGSGSGERSRARSARPQPLD